MVYVWEAMFVSLFDSFLGKFVAYCFFYIYVCVDVHEIVCYFSY